MKKSLLAIAVGLVSTVTQAGLDVKAPLLLEELVTIGSKEDARNIAGSGAVVDSEQMRLEASADINQLLKTVPGVYIREEDGAGLRPNIGIRGATSERSEKITLLEDGVMIAPAPYSNPAAYYFSDHFASDFDRSIKRRATIASRSANYRRGGELSFNTLNGRKLRRY